MSNNHRKIIPLERVKEENRADHFIRINENLLYLSRWFLNMLFFLVGDFAAFTLSFYLAGTLRDLFIGGSMLPEWYWFMFIAWSLGGIATRLMPGWGLGAVEELRRTVWLLCAVFAITVSALFLSKTASDTSRLTLTIAFFILIPLLPFVRNIVKFILNRLQLWGFQTIITGSISNCKTIIQTLRDEPGLGYQPIAILSNSEGDKPKTIEGVPVYEKEEHLLRYSRNVIFVKPDISRIEMAETMDGPLGRFRNVIIVSDLKDAPSLWVKTKDLGGILGLEVSHNLLDLWSRVLKRLSDVLLIVITFPFWSTFLIVIMFLVWLYDRHNPWYVQERRGANGTPFKMLKFRTMCYNAEAVLEKKLKENEALKQEWEKNHKLTNDPRITPVGRILRRTSLDELPQVINVLRGEMSLVGPRPLPGYHLRKLPERVQHLREKVRPGMTGLWQVSGRSSIGNEGINKWDVYYVRNWSIWLDIVIIIRTFKTVLHGKGAY